MEAMWRNPQFGMIPLKEDVHRDAVLMTKGRSLYMQQILSDWELIRAYLDDANERAFGQLLGW